MSLDVFRHCLRRTLFQFWYQGLMPIQSGLNAPEHISSISPPIGKIVIGGDSGLTNPEI